MTVVRDHISLRNLPVRAFDSRAQGFSPPLARQRSSCPPPSPNLVRTHLIENHQALRDIAPCLSRAATLPKATKLELGRGAHLKTPSSANHTAAARLKRQVGSRRQPVGCISREGEPGPTPAGKTLPHSYPETRFRRERARDVI